MANLVKIKEVCLYIGFTEHAQECFEMKKALSDAGITPRVLAYNDEAQHPELFASLSTWRWEDGVARTFTKFPIVHWKKCYDDFETEVQCATSVSELSDLLANKHLVG